MEEIPEITLKMDEVQVKGGFLTYRRLYVNKNWFGKLKMMWRWYWNESKTMSWLAYLDSPIKVKWMSELAQDNNGFHGMDAEAELDELLNKQFIDEVLKELEKEIKLKKNG